jgi:ATP-dependent DNA ligase
VKSAYLDGEVAVLTSDGLSDFEALQEALGRSRALSPTFSSISWRRMVETSVACR